MCDKQVMLAFAPHNLETDPEEAARDNSELLSDYIALKEAGFLNDVTENFKDLIAQAMAKGGRDVTVYCLTDAAYKMFYPAQGVN